MHFCARKIARTQTFDTASFTTFTTGKKHWIGCSLCTEALAFFPGDIAFLLAVGFEP